MLPYEHRGMKAECSSPYCLRPLNPYGGKKTPPNLWQIASAITDLWLPS